MDEFDEFVLFDRGNERLVCPDCIAVCAPDTPVRCDKDWCCCDCNQDDLDRHLAEELADPEFAAAYRIAQDRAAAARARELDDRGDDQLAAIARDIEAEARPTPTDLLLERYGNQLELTAERNRGRLLENDRRHGRGMPHDKSICRHCGRYGRPARGAA